MKKILLVVLTLSLFVLSGCISFYTYDDAKKYSIYTEEVNIDTITRIDVDWVSGSVIVKFGEKFSLVESGEKKIDGNEVLHYRYSDNKLSIKYCKSGIRVNIKKDLVITLPNKELDALDIESVSADVIISNLNIKDLDVETVSGRVELKSITSADLAIESTSGDINISDGDYQSMSIENVSGELIIKSNVSSDLEIESGSGNILVSIVGVKEMDIDTKSGDVTLELSEDYAFKLYYDTRTGDLSAQGFDIDGKYVSHNDGKLIYNIETRTGDLSIRLK